MVRKTIPADEKKRHLNITNIHGSRFQGRTELIKFLKGFRITRSQAIKAKCYDCMGFYDQAGDKDCRNHTCPLYTYMPYRNRKDAPEEELDEIEE